MSFRDYESAFDHARRGLADARRKCGREHVQKALGNIAEWTRSVDERDYRTFYANELAQAKKQCDLPGGTRLAGELLWYLNKRPYFNVYPIIAKKLAELDPEIDMSGLVVPYSAIEIRFGMKTVFCFDCNTFFLLVLNRIDGQFNEMTVGKKQRIVDVVSGAVRHKKMDGSDCPEAERANIEDIHEAVMLVVGVCMLALDTSIVQPVVLAESRHDNMTAEELERYKEKAIRRTGRVGFEIGRELQKPGMSIHYRNGCFAKYYVGKSHPQYPPTCIAHRSPVIKWRSGAVVNAKHPPKVPTGFKDLTTEGNDEHR